MNLMVSDFEERGFRLRVVLITLMVFIFVPPAFSRSELPLDRWRFRLSEETNEPAGVTFDDTGWESVALPHTWNALDGLLGGKYFRGTGWYRTHFQLPKNSQGSRVLLEFDAAFRNAEVFLNGNKMGAHIGGFARFRFDATDAVNFSGDNLVAVRVNSSTNDFIPRNGDFTMFGGLYRPARILLTSPAHLATMDCASPGVFFSLQSVSARNAAVGVKIELANDDSKKFSGAIRVAVNLPNGERASAENLPVKIEARSTLTTNLTVNIRRPHLWNSVADPFVYEVAVELADTDGAVSDSVKQPLGLRSFEVRPDGGFFLNGQHLQLHGVNRHQDYPGKGWAIGPKEMSEDFRILQELGANTVRLCHYQHDGFFMELCDHGGIGVWAELCFVNDPPFTDAGRENAKGQLRELIRQNFNHPSIFFWSIGNETWETATNGAAARLLTELATVAHEEDPSRLSVYASCHGADDLRNFRANILGWNKYYGWYDGEYSDFGKFLDDFHARYPGVSAGVSEFGAGASIYEHEENPPIRKGQAGSAWHPEELQAKFHEQYWLQIKSRPWLWGSYVWCLFDFASAGRTEGDVSGRNDKGLVTADRQTRKDAFYWYQANWTTNPMVHIVSKRFSRRMEPQTEIKIYSNADEVGVTLNGISLGKTNSSDCRFVWPDVTLKPGVNRIQATAWRQGNAVAFDSCAWSYTIEPDRVSK